MQPDDDRIPHSFSIAKEAGLHFKIGTTNLRGAHPNTAVLRLTGASGRKLEVVGASIGGGRINICQIDGITTNFGGDHNTLIVHNQDTPGHVAAVTTCLSQHGVNIATMQLYRSTAGATPSWCWSATSYPGRDRRAAGQPAGHRQGHDSESVRGRERWHFHPCMR